MRPEDYRLDDLRGVLAPRKRDAHKGDFGHVLVIGGNQGMAGAARMAAEAAARIGAGKVSVATRASHAPFVGLSRPELMVHAVEDAAQLAPLLSKASVVLVGPGLGLGDWAQCMWAAALQSKAAKVVDADGLNLLARNPVRMTEEDVLTPHVGEAKRLLGEQDHRVAMIAALRERFAGTWVLKGQGTLIQADHQLWRCVHGHPGMASAGMGDILAGMIAGLRAQGLAAPCAARLAVALHAAAGEKEAAVAGGRGMLALDLLPHVRRLLEDIAPC